MIGNGDRCLSADSSPNLSRGETALRSGAVLTIPPDTVPGVYYVGILLDRTNIVPELDENNNSSSVRIVVGSAVAAAAVRR